MIPPATAVPQSSALVLPPNETGMTPSLKKKGGSLGPILLLLVLLGGGGALAYMMLNNAEKQTPTNGVEPPPTPGSAGSAQVVAPQPDAAAAAIVQPTVGSDVPKTSETPLAPNGGSASKPPVNATTQKHPTPGSNTPKHPAVATVEDKVEPKAVIIKQINDAEAQSDWTAVRAGYQKLGKVKGMQQQALYGEALAAFQQGDTTSAENISTKAGSTPGPWKLKALLLHADAIFKQGDAKRAKDNYISLRALAGDKDFKATVTKKIALCNAKLGLAERDGIIN